MGLTGELFRNQYQRHKWGVFGSEAQTLGNLILTVSLINVIDYWILVGDMGHISNNFELM